MTEQEFCGHMTTLRRFAFKCGGPGDSPIETYAEAADFIGDYAEKLHSINAALLAACKAITDAAIAGGRDFDEAKTYNAYRLAQQGIALAEASDPQPKGEV